MGNITDKTGLLPCRRLFCKLINAPFQTAREVPRCGNFDGVFIQGPLWDTNWEVVRTKSYFTARSSKVWAQMYMSSPGPNSPSVTKESISSSSKLPAMRLSTAQPGRRDRGVD